MADNPVRNFLRNPFVPLVAAIAFALVALHEWQYRDAHPHAYGPAVQIVIGAVAGMVIGLAASALGFQNYIRDERATQLALELGRLRDRLNAGGEIDGGAFDRVQELCLDLTIELESVRDRLGRLEQAGHP